MNTTPGLIKKRRSKFSFTIRHLLLVIVAFGALFAVVGNYATTCRIQLGYIRSIERENGHVKCVERPTALRRAIASFAKRFLPAQAVDRPRDVYFPENRVLDERIASHVAALDGLESVSIHGGAVSEDALAAICKIGTLRALVVMVDGLGSDECVVLSRATQLNALQLRGKCLSRDDCERLSQLSNLEYLEIVECPLGQTDIDDIVKRSKVGRVSIERPRE